MKHREFEQYEMVRVYDKINEVYYIVAILRENGNCYTAKVLQQPPAVFVEKTYADDIFMHWGHPDDEPYQIPLTFNQERMTIQIHKGMCEPITHDARISMLKYLLYTNRMNSTHHQSIISEALDALQGALRTASPSVAYMSQNE